MRPEDLRRLQRQRPFRPFRLHLTSGYILDVRQPGVISIGRATVTVLLPPESAGEREALVPLGQIAWVEVLVPPGPA